MFMEINKYNAWPGVVILAIFSLLIVPLIQPVFAQDGTSSSATLGTNTEDNIEEGMDDDSLIMDTILSPDNAEAFVLNNLEAAQAHLKLLREKFSWCCAEDDMDYPGRGGLGTCSEGDFFLYFIDGHGGTSKSWKAGRPCSIGNAEDLNLDPATGSDTIKTKTGTKTVYWLSIGFWETEAKIGAARVSIGGRPCVLTINRVEIEQFGYSKVRTGQTIDKETKAVARSVTLQGGGDPVTVRVKIVGPAIMSGYKTSWKMEKGGKFRKKGKFKKVGSFWEAWAEIDLIKDPPAVVSLKISKGDYFRVFKGIRVWGRRAPLDRLILFRQGSGGFELEPADNIDIFLPSDDLVKGAIIESQSILKNGQIVPNWGAVDKGIEDVSIEMEDSTVAVYYPLGSMEEGNFQLKGNQPGSTRLWVRYKENAAAGRFQPLAEYYYVNVHQLWLTKVISTDKKPKLRLLGKGPRFAKYTAHFKGGEEASKKFERKKGFWQVEVPAEGVRRIELKDNKTGFRAAVLDVSRRTPAEAATIQLLQPDTPELTRLEALPLPGTNVTFNDWAVSSGFCSKVANNQLPADSKGLGVKEMGSLLGQAKQACANRQQAKTDIKEIRRIVSEFNGTLSGLTRGGMELVGLEDDTVNLAAAIRGLSWRHAEQAMCKWSLDGGEKSKFRFEYTPVTMVSTSSAASLNEVTNLIKGYEPGMKVNVELIIELNQ